MTDHKSRGLRKNIFLSASIEAGSLKSTVRIRNVSETGAMIEGAALPALGITFTLRRLDIEIGARVVWSSGGRCGIVFDGIVHVDEWIAGKRRANVTGLSGQARVDAIQAAIRAGQPLDAIAANPSVASVSRNEADPSPDALLGRISDEIAASKRVVDQVADRLSDDPLMLSRHMTELQSLQSVSEILGHLARSIQAEDVAAAVETINLQGLRARLLKKPLF